MSCMEMSKARSINDDAKFDADIKFGHKETNKKFTMQDGIQDADPVDQVADGAFMGSPALVPVNQEEFGRCKRVRKPTQKGLEYQKLKSKLERK